MKKLSLAIINILGTALLSTTANAASFDCNKANTWVEKTICANAELSTLDNAMAEKYKRDLANTSDYEDSEIFKGNMIIDQRLWLRFQRNTCKDTECLSREYKEYIEDKNYHGVAWDFTDKLNRSNLPSKNSFGEFSQDVDVPMYSSETNNWKVIAKTTNSVSIHRVVNKPYLAIIEGILIFTNGHTCEIEASKAIWSQNHWVINDDQQDKTAELRLYPALYKGKPQLLLKDMDNKYRELHCGMRGYFDGIVLERE
ncbi:lysozyme inhibitor LprI family protein [Psychrobacter sp. AOP22-C1-C5]|uniref:lysozyme inhibitor LprI family protein n=1 Tax=Psychrobacter sp. AOP22-C1-C5 TaxID=3457716 RepID=UPI004036867C